jgi:hypothetical protein
VPTWRLAGELLTDICRARCPKSAPQFECRSRRGRWRSKRGVKERVGFVPISLQKSVAVDEAGPGRVTIPLIAARAGGLGACTDARDTQALRPKEALSVG